MDLPAPAVTRPTRCRKIASEPSVIDKIATVAPAKTGLLVTVYRRTQRGDRKLGTAGTNGSGVATFTHSERPGSVLDIWIKLAASSTTNAATAGPKRVTIKRG